MAVKTALAGFLLLVTAAGSPAPAARPKTSLNLTYPPSYDVYRANTKPIKEFSHYPCHFLNSNDVSGMFLVQHHTRLKAGEKHEAIIQGNNTHSGGSCQFSVSVDNPPTLNSEFKVITSIEGNCPGEIDRKMDPQPFWIPKDAANGDYTLAWTWFPESSASKKPEMWMICAPITIYGGRDKKKPKTSGKGWMKKLPTMFIANVNVKSFQVEKETLFDQYNKGEGEYGPPGRWSRPACITKPDKNVAFPYPGSIRINRVETGFMSPDFRAGIRKGRSPDGPGCAHKGKPVKFMNKDWTWDASKSSNEIKENDIDAKGEKDIVDLVARDVTHSAPSGSSTGPPATTPYTTTTLTTITQVRTTTDLMGEPSTFVTTRTINQVIVVTPTPAPRTTVYTTSSTTVITYYTTMTSGTETIVAETSETVVEEQVVTPAPPPASSTPAPVSSTDASSNAASSIPSPTTTQAAPSIPDTSNSAPSIASPTTTEAAPSVPGTSNSAPSIASPSTTQAVPSVPGTSNSIPSIASPTTTQAAPSIAGTSNAAPSIGTTTTQAAQPGTDTSPSTSNSAAQQTTTSPSVASSPDQTSSTTLSTRFYYLDANARYPSPFDQTVTVFMDPYARFSILPTTFIMRPGSTVQSGSTDLRTVTVEYGGNSPLRFIFKPTSGGGTVQTLAIATPRAVSTTPASPSATTTDGTSNSVAQPTISTSPSVTSSPAQLPSTSLSTKLYYPSGNEALPQPPVQTITVSSDTLFPVLPTTFLISPGPLGMGSTGTHTVTIAHDQPSTFEFFASDYLSGSATPFIATPRAISSSSPSSPATMPTTNSASNSVVQPTTTTSPSVVSTSTPSVPSGTSLSLSNTSPSVGSTTTQNAPSGSSGSPSQISSSPATQSITQISKSASASSAQASSSTMPLITRRFYAFPGAEMQTRTVTVNSGYSVTPSIFVLAPTDTMLPGTALTTITAEYDGASTQRVALYDPTGTRSNLPRGLTTAYSFAPRAPQATDLTSQDYTLLVETPRPTPSGTAFSAFVTSSTIFITHVSTDSDAIYNSYATDMTTYTTSTPVTRTQAPTSSSSMQTRPYFFPPGQGVANAINTITVTYGRGSPPTRTYVLTPIQSTPAATPASYVSYTITAQYNGVTSQTIVMAPAPNTAVIPTYTYVVELPYPTGIDSSATDFVPSSPTSSATTSSTASPSSASSSTSPSFVPPTSSPGTSSSPSSSTGPSPTSPTSSPGTSSSSASTSPSTTPPTTSPRTSSSSLSSTSTAPSPSTTSPPPSSSSSSPESTSSAPPTRSSSMILSTRYFALGYFGDMAGTHSATALSRYSFTPSSWLLAPTTTSINEHGIGDIITAAYEGFATRTLLLFAENPAASTYTVLVETPKATSASITSSDSGTPSSSPISSTPSPVSSSSPSSSVVTPSSSPTSSTPSPVSSSSPSSSVVTPSSSSTLSTLSPASSSSPSSSVVTPSSSPTSSTPSPASSSSPSSSVVTPSSSPTSSTPSPASSSSLSSSMVTPSSSLISSTLSPVSSSLPSSSVVTPSSSPTSSTPSPASSSSISPSVVTSGSPITLSIPTTSTPIISTSFKTPMLSSSSASPSSSDQVSSPDTSSRITPCSSCSSSSTSVGLSSDDTNMRTHTHTHTRTYEHTITHPHFVPSSSSTPPPPSPSTQTPPSPDSRSPTSLTTPESPSSSATPLPPSTTLTPSTFSTTTRSRRTRTRTRSPTPPSSSSSSSATPTPSPSPSSSLTPAPAPSPSPARRCTPANNGQLVCKAGDKSVYALCDNGRVRWQPVAPGTQCVNDAIVAASDDNAKGNKVVGTASTPPASTPSPTPAPPPSTIGNTIATQQQQQSRPPPVPTTAAQSSPCQSDGKLYCNGEGLFGLCNWGVVTWQSVAPGTKCVDGAITYADADAY